MPIQEIPFGSELYELTKRFREEVLRRPLGLVLSPQDVDGEDQQIHIAAVEPGDRILGTVVLKPLSPEVMKLRQMAVAPELHGKGMGRNLVRFAEQISLNKEFRLIEMTARVSAIGFYEKLGYRTTGDEFTEVTLPAIKMTRDIRKSAI